MTPAILERLLPMLEKAPVPLVELHTLARQEGSGWSPEQLLLFFTCLDGIEVDTTDQQSPRIHRGQRSAADELSESIFQIVQSRKGQPIPAQQVLAMLPERFTTSVEQVKAIARTHPDLEVVGPGFIRER